MCSGSSPFPWGKFFSLQSGIHTLSNSSPFEACTVSSLSDWIGRAVGSESYAAVLLTRLKREGEVKLRSKDGIRGYLLRNKAKQYLLVHYWDDVRLYLSGANSTNHVKSEPEKRLRLHRMK